LSILSNPTDDSIPAKQLDPDGRQRGEEALRRSEERYRALVVASNQVV
jgi:hypothetical protein